MATVRAKIVSAVNQDPLDSASVEVVDSKGNYLGQGVKSDNTGKFSFTSSILPGNYLLISYQGLLSTIVEADDYIGSTYKLIELYPKELAEVVVTPKKKKFPWWIVIVGGSAVVLLSSKKKKRGARIGDVSTGSGPDFSKYIIPAGAVLIGAFAVGKILQAVGILDSEEEKAQKEAEKKAKAAQELLKDKNYGTAIFNYTKSFISGIASDMKTASSGWSYDYRLLIHSMAYVKAMRAADAQYFLGVFVEINGQTLYQWWVHKFQDAYFLGHPTPNLFEGVEAVYKAWGIEPGWVSGPGLSEITEVVVNYTYKVAGIPKQ